MELTSWDVEQLDRMVDGDKKAGMIVETKKGLIGRTYSNETLINGKVRVYLENDLKMLCDPAKLKLKGFIN